MFVTINDIYKNDYLNLLKNRYTKKIVCLLGMKTIYFSFFDTITSVTPSVYRTSQLIESPIFMSKNFIISLGIVVLPELLFGLASETFVSYSNTFIPPYLYFVIYNMIFSIYISFLFVGRNIYILQQSNYYTRRKFRMAVLKFFQNPKWCKYEKV